MANLNYSTQLIEEDDINGVVDVLKSSHLAQGKKVEEFEKALSKYTKTNYAITFNSATSALYAAYLACGIKEGDEVITSPISFVATSNMFVKLGAMPVWCDIKEDGNLNEELIESLITLKTKAIVPVHFAGKPTEMEKIHNIAKKHKLIVIEDGAHALGSGINNQKIGSFSDMTIFSFHAIKPITTSEGGAIVTNNKEYADKLKLIRSHGIIKKSLWKSDMLQMGYNFRMTEVAGSLGCTQIKKLDRFIKIRNQIAEYYDERFKNEKLFSILKIDKNLNSSRHLYPILLSREIHYKKEQIFQELQERGLGVQVHYKPIYQNSFYKEKFGEVLLPVADNFYNSEISIPCNQTMGIDDAKYVADTVIEVLNKHAKDL